MKLLPWDALPEMLRTEAVRPYYLALQNRRVSLVLKRVFDIITALVLLLLFAPLFLLLFFAIKLDSKGPAFYCQERITQYGKVFRIWKFRTMVTNADTTGELVTTENDVRITRIGKVIRKCRLDEIPQLFNVLRGEMTFVGTRPEVSKYVAVYTPEMQATLLLPAGITSQASIRFKNEDELLVGANDIDEMYIHRILPAKMRFNLYEIRTYTFWRDIRTMFETVLAVFGVLKETGDFSRIEKETTHL